MTPQDQIDRLHNVSQTVRQAAEEILAAAERVRDEVGMSVAQHMLETTRRRIVERAPAGKREGWIA